MEKKKRITIAQIAELAGVSKATASLVLNGKSAEYRIADQTQKRIQAVVDAGACPMAPTTVIDLSQGGAQVLRQGRGELAPLGLSDLSD